MAVKQASKKVEMIAEGMAEAEASPEDVEDEKKLNLSSLELKGVSAQEAAAMGIVGAGGLTADTQFTPYSTPAEVIKVGEMFFSYDSGGDNYSVMTKAGLPGISGG